MDPTAGWPPMPEPPGPVDASVAPEPVLDVARPAWSVLMAPGWTPPAAEVTHAIGICFTDGGKVVLVSWDDKEWTLPGGGVEAGETVEEALIREVAEEACATVTVYRYVACAHIADPCNTYGLTSFYQTYWWARVVLDPWEPAHEMVSRRLVTPDEAVEALCRPARVDSDTVAFGSRDCLLLPRQSRHFEQLPPGTHFAALPGCGHVPMPDDPDAVAAFIVEASVRVPAAR